MSGEPQYFKCLGYDAGHRRLIRDTMIFIGVMISEQAKRSKETFKYYPSEYTRKLNIKDAKLQAAFDKLMDEDFW